MKQTTFTFLLLSVICLMSCRKDKNEPDIKQYDQTQIENYIKANGLTGFVRDTTGGDTTGIYYKVIMPGSGTPLQYTDKVKMVYTVKTFDDAYSSLDTINNHYDDYLGHLYSNRLSTSTAQIGINTIGLQTAVHNSLKYPGASIRVLIPSHLSYGLSGYGSGSSQVANNKIKGNECIDYTIHVIGNTPYNATTNTPSDIAVYDDMVINNYLKANSLTGYTKVQSTLLPGNYYYYKVLTPGTGDNPITVNSTVTTTYTGQLFNAYIFDGLHNGTNPASFDINGLIEGAQEALINYAVVGTDISLMIPSSLAYGDAGQTGIPPFSCLRFTFIITATTP